jgi:hypothetical protein
LKVKLFTQDRHFVVEGYLPLFNRAPDVLLWGERLFVQDGDGDSFLLKVGMDGYGTYREAFSFALVPGHERDLAPGS